MIETLLHEIISSEEKLFLVLGASLLVLFTLINAVSRIVIGVASERTKREIAAYIAEGSMSPEQGERILKAGRKKAESWCG